MVKSSISNFIILGFRDLLFCFPVLGTLDFGDDSEVRSWLCVSGYMQDAASPPVTESLVELCS